MCFPNCVRGFLHIWHTFTCIYLDLWSHGNTSCIFAHIISSLVFFFLSRIRNSSSCQLPIDSFNSVKFWFDSHAFCLCYFFLPKETTLSSLLSVLGPCQSLDTNISGRDFWWVSSILSVFILSVRFFYWAFVFFWLFLTLLSLSYPLSLHTFLFGATGQHPKSQRAFWDSVRKFLLKGLQ